MDKSTPYLTQNDDSVWTCPPKPFSSHQRVFALTVFLLAAGFCIAMDLRLHVLAADDSYIHLRIAEHLVHTGHAFFNSGERVMVTSSPLWTILLGLSSLLSRSLPAALPLEALAVGGACALAYLAADSLSECRSDSSLLRWLSRLGVPAATFVLLAQSSLLQMETPLAIALLLASILLWYRDSAWWLTVLVLAGFVRYEFFLIGIVLFGGSVFLRLIRLKVVLPAVAVLAFGIGWLAYQFGTLIPNTIRVKSMVYLVTTADVFNGLHLSVARCLLIVATVSLLLFSRSYTQSKVASLLLISGLVLYSLYIVRKTFIFPWYTPLPLAPLLFGLLLGGAIVLKGWQRGVILLTVLLLLPVRLFCHQVVAAVMDRPWQDTEDSFNVRAREYILVGRAVHNACPRARVLSSEIGGLGIGFPGEILDGLGLASPAAIKYHPMRVPDDRKDGLSGDIPPGFVNQTRPDVIITYDRFSTALRRDYDHSAYDVTVYSALPEHEGVHYSMWYANHLYVFIARAGICPKLALNAEIRKEISSE